MAPLHIEVQDIDKHHKKFRHLFLQARNLNLENETTTI